MTENQAEHITRLLGKYKSGSTESLIAYIAGTNGMLAACRELLDRTRAGDQFFEAWLRTKCDELSIDISAFCREIEQVVALFGDHHKDDDPYSILDVPMGASTEEIKHAYRKLSRIYHPDTASAEHKNDTDRFIKITRAYHTLMGGEEAEPVVFPKAPVYSWRQEKQRTVSSGQRKKTVLLVGGLIVVMMVISLVAAVNYRQRSMIVGLQRSNGAFVPPANHKAADNPGTSETDLSDPQTGEKSPTAAAEQTVSQEVPAREEIPAHEELKSLPVEKIGSAIAVAATEREKIADNNAQQREKDTAPIKTAESPAKLKPQGEISQSATSAGNKDANISDNNQEVAERREPRASAHEKQTVKEAKAVVPLPQHETKERVVVRAPESATAEVAALSEKSIAALETSRLADNTSVEVVLKDTVPVDKNESVEDGLTTKKQVEEKVEKEETSAESVDLAATAAPEPKMSSLPVPAHDGKEDNLPVQSDVKHVPVQDQPTATVPDIQERIDAFLKSYTDTYGKKNIVSFTRFFDPEARENGKPFTEMIPVYADLFSSVSGLSLDISVLNLAESSSTVTIRGRFNVHLVYKDSRELDGKGSITFVLVEKDADNSYKIKEITYTFDN